MNTKQLIEELKQFTEEDFIEDEIVDEFETPIISDVNLNDTANLADELDAKTKIARALEVLKKAVDDFKNSTVTEIDLINDSTLLSTIEAIDEEIKTIESSLSGKVETDDEQITSEIDIEDETEDETEEETTDEPDFNIEEIDFDDAASLDFFGNEEESGEETEE